MQRLQRFFALTSLATILLAALAFSLLHRAFILEDLSEAAQLRTHATLSALANTLGNEAGHLATLTGESRKALLSSPVIHAVNDKTQTIVADIPIKRVSVIGRDGTVLYSTQDTLIGRATPIPDGLEAALAGAYWDQGRVSATADGAAALFQGIEVYLTRMPLRDSTGTVVAALAVELDTTDMLVAANRRQVWFVVLACAVLALAYLSLQVVVRRAGAIIQVEQDRLREETWRRQAVAAALEQRERLLNTIADSLPTLLTYVGPDLRYRFNNARYEDWFGVPAAEAVGQRVPDLVGAENFARVRRNIERVLRGETVTFEAPFQTRRGLIQARFDFVPHRDEDGNVEGYVSLVTDVSDFKRLEEELREAQAQTEGLVERRTHELRDSEQRFRDFAEATSDWFWETDADHRVIWVSIGSDDAAPPPLDVSQAMGLSRPAMIARDDPEAARLHVIDLDAHRPFRDFTYAWHDPTSGTRHFIKSSGKPMFDAEGRFQGYRGVAADIGVQKAAEDRARRAELMLTEAMDSIADGFTLWDAEDRLVIWNQRFEAFFGDLKGFLRPGITFEETLRVRASWPGVGLVVDQEEVGGSAEDRFARRLAAHRQAEGTIEVRNPYTGTWILVTERRTRDGGIVALYTDITARKAAELALRDSEQALRDLHRVTAEALSDSNASIAALLRFGVRHFGHDLGLLLRIEGGRPVVVSRVSRDASPGADGDADTIPLAQGALLGALDNPEPMVLPTGEPPDAAGALAQRVLVGSDRFLLAFVSTGDGPTVCSSTDRELIKLMAQWLGGVLSRDRAAEELRQAKEQAETANRTKSEFLANMSHELRTPLNAIIGFSDVMRQQVLGPIAEPRYLEYLESVHDSGQHLLEIINDILDVSKIEAGQLELYEDIEDLAALADSALRLVAERAEQGKLTVATAGLRGLPPVRVEGRRIKQVLLNLLSNAVKFTPSGGSIRLEARRAPDGGVALCVADTGVGMTEAEQDLALMPFGQVESSASRRYEGTGLGLPLTRALMALHGGDLTLSSRKGEGTTVTVTLPPDRVLDAEGAPGGEARP
jgi:PAS domain S-box-containing protein